MNYFEILGIKPTKEIQAIKEAYGLRLAALDSSEADFKSKSQKLTEAFQFLSDQENLNKHFVEITSLIESKKTSDEVESNKIPEKSAEQEMKKVLIPFLIPSFKRVEHNVNFDLKNAKNGYLEIHPSRLMKSPAEYGVIAEILTTALKVRSYSQAGYNESDASDILNQHS